MAAASGEGQGTNAGLQCCQTPQEPLQELALRRFPGPLKSVGGVEEGVRACVRRREAVGGGGEAWGEAGETDV